MTTPLVHASRVALPIDLDGVTARRSATATVVLTSTPRDAVELLAGDVWIRTGAGRPGPDLLAGPVAASVPASTCVSCSVDQTGAVTLTVVAGEPILITVHGDPMVLPSRARLRVDARGVLDLDLLPPAAAASDPFVVANLVLDSAPVPDAVPSGAPPATRRPARMVRAVGTVIGLLVGAFAATWWLGSPVREFEARLAASLVEATTTGGSADAFGPLILLLPGDGSFLVAELLPSCSSWSALLALTCLGLIGPRRPGGRRWVGLAVALGTVFGVNLARISASAGIGLVAGERALVLFHDVVGTIATLLSVIGGYLLMLAIQSPRTEETP